MFFGRFCASALLVALATANSPGHEERDCAHHDCVAIQKPAGPHPDVYLQEVVWVNKLGEVVCTITETVTAKPSATAPPPPPPPPPVKVVEHKEKETTTLTTASTTTIIAKPTEISAPPKPHPPPPAEKHVVVEETSGCPGGCDKDTAKVDVPVTVIEGECDGSCGEASDSSPKHKPVPMPTPKPDHGDKGNGGPPSTNIRTSHGVSYAAYRADHSCKTKEDIDDDFDQMKGLYSVVRTYGVDCHQVEYIYEAAKRIGVKVFYGIWDLDAVEEEAKEIAAGVNGDWEIVDSISVGNELVNNGEATPDQVVSAVKQARAILRKEGFEGPVVAVDTFIATEEHPQLCEMSDYCAINAHAFFDGTISAEEAGPWLVRTVKSMKSKLSTEKRVIITETGWPTEGAANGLAVPGLKNQKVALESISKSFAENPGDIILFSAFNDLWKGDRDKYWGIGGAVSRCDR